MGKYLILRSDFFEQKGIKKIEHLYFENSSFLEMLYIRLLEETYLTNGIITEKVIQNLSKKLIRTVNIPQGLRCLELVGFVIREKSGRMRVVFNEYAYIAEKQE